MSGSSSGPKDMFGSRAAHGKSFKENITPHRISVIIFIRDLCDIKKSFREGNDSNGTASKGLSSSNRRCYAILILKLIQGEDMDLAEFEALLNANEASLLPLHVENFFTNVWDLTQNGIGTLQDLIQGLGTYLTEPTHLSPIVNRCSVIGIFFRRMMLLFDKLSFSQVVSIFRSFQQYAETWHKGSTRKPGSELKVEVSSLGLQNEVEMSLCDSTRSPGHDLSSLAPLSKDDGEIGDSKYRMRYLTRRQAELFIAQQANLIQTNETEALSPADLQRRILDLLKVNPEYAEAHYLSYMNCVRSKEFCGAIDSLFHCFDRNTLISDTKYTTPEEKSRGSRYAALNLAILYAHFGHKKEALSALKGAITLAHENSDNVCLQHALAWLYKLTDENKEVLMERSISKSSDLNLCHLTSLGIQSFAHYAGITAGKPALVFDLLMKSDALNCQHSLIDLMCNSYAQKAALWAMYGKTDMMSISSQLLLHLNTANIMLGVNEYNGEGTCQAICNIVNILMEKGDYPLASLVLHHARLRFPHEPMSHTWLLCEHVMFFTRAIYQEKWHEAAQAVAHLHAIDKWEGQLRKAEMYVAQCDYSKASKCVYRLMDSGLSGDETICPSTRVRAYILAAEIQCYSSSLTRTPAVGITLFMSSLNLSQIHYLDYLAAMVGLHLANIQLQMGLPTQALKLIDQYLLAILTNGGYYDQARALLLLVKCKIAATSGSPEPTRRAVLNNAIRTLNKVKYNFVKVEASSRVKDVVYLQALIFNELGNHDEKLRSALEFRQLNEQYTTKMATTLLTRL